MKRAIFLFLLLCAASAHAQTVTTQFTAQLTDSGDNAPIMPVVADATEPAEPLTPAFHVAVPNAQAPRMMTLVSPAIAIPFNSRIRQIEAYWNGTPLPLIDPSMPSKTQLTEEAHSYGSMIPFFKPLFSVASIPAGSGTLEIRAFDANHTQLAAQSISGLSIVKPPAPVSTATIAAMRHPRIYLTADRITNMLRNFNGVPAHRYDDALNAFDSALQAIPDVTSTEFSDRIYDPEDYIPLLALAVRLCTGPTCSSPALLRLQNAAHTLTMQIANDYATHKRDFGRDTGYDIRFGLRDLMLAYDWMYDAFTPDERKTIVSVATQWIDWYHTGGYAETWPVENYYAGYLQGIALVAVATAGDNPDADRIFSLLRTKLTNEVPIMNQRLAGGDWAEGWNYGWYSVLELSLVNTLLKDLGEDWSADFDWMSGLPTSLMFMTAPDFSQTFSFGGYSGNYPDRTSPATLAVLSSNSAIAGYLYSSMLSNPNNDFTDLPADTFYEVIFGKPSAPPPLPFMTTYFNSGTGRWFSRIYPYTVTAENTSYSYDHYGYANGDVRLYKGSECLVCPSAYRGPAFDGEAGTEAFSTYTVNGSEQNLPLGRNNQNLFTISNADFDAIGMRFESSWANSRYDEDIVNPVNPLDYMIREAVHVHPGTLVVRDLHRRRHASDTLVGRFHLGSDSVKISRFYPAGVTVTMSDDKDGGGNKIGTLMQLDFASSTDPMELVTVFSDTLTATSYANGVLTLSDGRKVIFANGTVALQGSTAGRRRAINH